MSLVDSKKPSQFIYIIQAFKEPSKCKIGITNDLDRRLKEYNSMTGVSKENLYEFLFSAEVLDSKKVERDLKAEFLRLREEKSREIYFYNKPLFEEYVAFIKNHTGFVREIFTKKELEPRVKIVKKTTPSLKERGINTKDILERARSAKYDEFYTRYEDIEKEIESYPIEIWQDKCVFCNCDDAVGDEKNDVDSSAFALYFLRNFERLKLKKLICTHYRGKVDLFNAGSQGYIFTKEGFKEIKEYPRGFDGSFDSKLSLEILNNEADIICTNPPFSLAIRYWQILIESKKKFLIISNIANCVNNFFIPYLKDKKTWGGYNRIDWFLNPKRQLTDASAHWYTNFEIKERPKQRLLKIMPLKKIPKENKQYDDNGTLVVSKGYIPNDYDLPFAVSARQILNGVLDLGFDIAQKKKYTPIFNGKIAFARVLIQKFDFTQNQ